VFGLQAEWFYAFTILLHFLNTLLVRELFAALRGSHRIGLLAAALFAVVQNPQEAIMWLAAMGDALAALCVLTALLLWLKNRFVSSALVYSAGLLSKESAVVLLLLVPLAEFCTCGKLRVRVEYVYLLVPTAAFGIVFLWTAPHNYLLTAGSYAFGLQGLWVWAVSMHRLLFPWMYLAAGALLVSRRLRVGELVPALVWMTITLLPYVFLTYQNHVPSRHQYLASMGLAWGLALLASRWHPVGLRATFVAAFIATNVGYLWLVKDAQFERRAAPTTRLLESLGSRAPGRVRVVGFPLNPGMATTATRLIPGWKPEMVLVNEPRESCPDCPELRWEPVTSRYKTGRAVGVSAQEGPIPAAFQPDSK